MFEPTNRIFQHNVPRAISCHNFRMKLVGCCELSFHLGAPSTFDVVTFWNISVLVLIVSWSIVAAVCASQVSVINYYWCRIFLIDVLSRCKFGRKAFFATNNNFDVADAQNDKNHFGFQMKAKYFLTFHFFPLLILQKKKSSSVGPTVDLPRGWP